jgi:hypothetical protein
MGRPSAASVSQSGTEISGLRPQKKQKYPFKGTESLKIKAFLTNLCISPTPFLFLSRLACLENLATPEPSPKTLGKQDITQNAGH